MKHIIHVDKNGVKIGIGSGIFAEKLNIKFGTDPSEKMLNYAAQRKLSVKKDFAENLPYPDKNFGFAAFVITICFVDNPEKAIKSTSDYQRQRRFNYGIFRQRNFVRKIA